MKLGLRVGLLTAASITVLTAAGALLLAQPWATPREPDQFRWFWSRHYWQCAHDALSAVCCVGFLSLPAERGYTLAGKWVLVGLAQAGALLAIGMSAWVLPRWLGSIGVQSVRGPQSHRPEAEVPQVAASHPPSFVLRACAAFLVIEFSLLILVYLAGRSLCPTVTLEESARLVLNAAAGAGLADRPLDVGTAWTTAFVGLIAALGWPTWLLWHRDVRRHAGLRRVARWNLAGLALLLIGASGLVWLLEAPRGQARSARVSELPQSPQPSASQQAIHAALTSVNAATSGMPLAPLVEPTRADGAQALLAFTAAIGGGMGAPMTGVTTALLWLALRGRHGARGLLHAAFWLTVVATLLLLSAEQITASAYQPRPGVGAAWLDGAGLVTGSAAGGSVVGLLAPESLTRGLALPVDLFQVILGTRMALMLVGRCWLAACLAARFPKSQLSSCSPP